MGYLADLCDVPLATGIDRQALVVDLVLELSDPEDISQGRKRTCAAAAVQILLAAKYPAEYARL